MHEHPHGDTDNIAAHIHEQLGGEEADSGGEGEEEGGGYGI